MSQGERRDVRSIMLDTNLVELALHKAVVEDRIRHKRLGSPMVVWRNGQVFWIPAEDIQIPDEVTSAETNP